MALSEFRMSQKRYFFTISVIKYKYHILIQETNPKLKLIFN